MLHVHLGIDPLAELVDQVCLYLIPIVLCNDHAGACDQHAASLVGEATLKKRVTGNPQQEDEDEPAANVDVWHWKDEDVQAGPLPALFLRETAARLEASPVPLGLFLGSDYPISPSNRFQGAQAEAFAAGDANTAMGIYGQVLQALNPDEHVYPASLTKMMTLYVLFEDLERGRDHLAQRDQLPGGAGAGR